MAQSSSSSLADYKPPGRIGDPNMTLATEPRLDPRLLQVFKSFGMDKMEFPEPLAPDASLEQLAANMQGSHSMVLGLYDALDNELPGDEELKATISVSTVTFKAPAGNDVDLHVFRPKALEGKAATCVVYIHGGGMTILPTRNKVHDMWCMEVASHGVVCIALDFRNAWTEKGYNHYPLGLDDCCAGVQYIASHREELGISNMIVHGESGGGNLTLTTALRANKEGWIKEISGVWATIPYISNAWSWPRERRLAELPSTVECDTYFLNMGGMSEMGTFYAPKDKQNPLAWAYHATEEMMKGLPPHVIAVDELDPLRDEGLSYSRRLLRAGVSSVGRIGCGCTHGAALIFRQALADIHRRMASDVASFAKDLASAGGAIESRL